MTTLWRHQINICVFYYFRYILGSVSGLPYLQKPWVSHHDKTKLSPVYIIFIHVDGKAKNYLKKLRCLHFNCFMLRTFPCTSWHSLPLYAWSFVKTRITKQRVGLGQDEMLAVISEQRENFTVIGSHFSWFEITWQGGNVSQQNNTNLLEKKKFSSQERERLSFCPLTWPPWLQLQTSNTDKKLFVFKQKRLDICVCTRKTISEKEREKT